MVIVISVYCCTRLAQLSTFFVFKIPIFVKFQVGDGLCISKTSFQLENINPIGKCYRGLLLYSPTTARHNFLFFKISIFVKFQVGNGLCISKTSFHLENINLFGKCYEVYCSTRLPQLSTTFCFSKFLFLWNPGSVLDYVFWKRLFI